MTSSERQYLRAIRALKAAGAAMSDLPIAPNEQSSDYRRRLRNEIDEYAEYLEKAAWWRGSK